MYRSKLAIVAFLIVLTVPFAVAQVGRGAGPGMRNYDPSSEVTVTGGVEDIQQYTTRGWWGGTHLILKTSTDTLDVHVGPTSYLDGQQFSFTKGDQVEVIGSKIKVDGKDALLAREIKKDGKVLKLRDTQGIPLWSRGRRNP